ncbi:hypothetical protein DDI_0249 [Dickeya dianthicola RNS04.9]|nr:hypothetical protein DDI_0249 [Dickeya dianthicola RNS04.9]
MKNSSILTILRGNIVISHDLNILVACHNVLLIDYHIYERYLLPWLEHFMLR